MNGIRKKKKRVNGVRKKINETRISKTRQRRSKDEKIVKVKEEEKDEWNNE